ncbi:MAG TPA: helix-turn-helix domain-containing protein [Caulobacteraceae bacterium]
MQTTVVPSFFLFGEAPRAVGDRFLHLESLDERTRPNNWNIRPHSHASLNHIFHIAEGQGEMRAEAEVLAFRAPCLLLVPATVVHGFNYRPGASGTVVTLSEDYLRALAGREPVLAQVFRAPRVAPLERGEVDGRLQELAQELVWEAPGHAAAVESLLLSLMVTALRRLRQAQAESEPSVIRPQARLVARFREAVERRYRTDAQLRDYADELGVTPSRLRGACLAVVGETPLRVIQDRLLLEARRGLLYSNMTVKEVADHLGFEDPAYFTRFFTRREGASPRAFRQGRRPGEGISRSPKTPAS